MSRILLSIRHHRQRDLLQEWLAGEHDVATQTGVNGAAAGVTGEGFKLAVVDRRALPHVRSMHALRRLPLLLVCSRRALSGLDRRLASAADDVSLTPLTEPDVQRRVAALLRASARSQLRQEPEPSSGWWSDQRLASVLESGGAGIWDWDTQTGQFNISQNLEAAYGLPRGGLDTYDRFLDTIHPDDRQQLISRLLRGATKGEPVQLEFRTLWPDGSVHWIALQSRGIRDESGKVVRISGLVTNIDARKDAEQALRHNEERLRLAVEGADIGLWDWDIAANHIYFSERWKRQIGFTDEEFPNRIDEWDRRLHPADRQRLHQAAMTYLHQPAPNQQIEFRLRHKDGSYRWISSRSAVMVGADGRPSRMLGADIDITERKRAEITTTVLLDVARDISSTSDRDELLNRVQKRIATALSCDAVVVVYRRPDEETFRAISHYGIPESLAQAVMSIELSPRHLLKGRFISRGVPLTINEPRQAEPRIATLAEQFGFRAVTASPLYVCGRPLGALLAFRTLPDTPFETAEVELFNAIAQQVAVALESLDLHRAQAEETLVASTMAHLGQSLVGSLDPTTVLARACKETAEALQCDSAYVLLRNEDQFDVVAGHGESFADLDALPLQLPSVTLAPLFERLRERGVVQVSPKRDSGSGSALMERYGITRTLNVALKQDGNIVGLLVAACREPERRFSPLDNRIAVGIGELVSVALERADLVQKTDRANRTRTEFVATMSHELRTPLNIIAGYNGLLLDDVFGPLNPGQRDTLGRVAHSTTQLVELVETVLDLSRLEGGRIPLELELVELSTLVGEICDETQPLFQAKPGLQWVWHEPAGLPAFRTDPRKLKVIVKNLVGNAIKFTDAGTVSVSARADDGRVEIEVTDSGIGIPADVLPTIFDAFRQGDGSSTRSYGGVGLGLYIVHRLVEELGGTTTVESEVGTGSTFRIALPVAGPYPSRESDPSAP